MVWLYQQHFSCGIACLLHGHVYVFLVQPDESAPAPEDPTALFSALVSEQREKIAEMSQDLKRKIVVEIKQVVQTQQGELDALLNDQENAYRAAALRLLKKKQLLLKHCHDKEDKYMDEWTQTLKKTLKRAVQERSLRAPQDENLQTPAALLGAAVEEALAQVAQRHRAKAERQSLELKLVELEHTQRLEICEKEIGVLRNQVRTELVQFRMIIAKDVAANVDLAAHLGKKQLQGLLRQELQKLEARTPGVNEDEEGEENKRAPAAEPSFDITPSLIEGLRKMIQDNAKAADLELELMQTVKKSTDELRHLVASTQDVMEQEQESLHVQWLNLMLKEVEARNSAWEIAAEQQQNDRMEAEKQIVLHANRERTMQVEAQGEICNVLHTMLTHGLEGRLRAFARINKTLRRRRLKAWKQLAVSTMMLNAANIRHCWEDVVDSGKQESEALDNFSERRTQLSRRSAANIKRILNRDRKRRAQQRASLEIATALIAQPRSETGVAVEDATLQQAVDAAANRQHEEEFHIRKAELDCQLEEALMQLEQARADILQKREDTKKMQDDSAEGMVPEETNEEEPRVASEEQVLSELEQRKAELIAAHETNVKRLEAELAGRLAEGQQKLMLNLWDLTVEMESSPQRLNLLAHNVREEIDDMYEAEKMELDERNEEQSASISSQPSTESCDSGSQRTGGRVRYELRLLQLKKTRCERLLDRLSRLADKEGPVAVAYVNEASKELERLREEEIYLKATQKAELERELAKLSDEKEEAEKRLAETLNLMQKEWEEKLDRTQMEGRARLEVTRQNARWHKDEAGDVDEKRKQLLQWHRLEVQNLQEALDTEYVRQRRSLEEKLQHKMLLKRRRLVQQAEEELKTRTQDIQKARDAFVSEQEPLFFFSEEKRRQLVLRIGREWRQKARNSARAAEVGEKRSAEPGEEGETEDKLPPLQKLSTAEFRRRVTALRRAAGHAIVEVCDVVRRLRPPSAGVGQTARPATNQPGPASQLSNAVDTIEEVVRDLKRINSLYYSALPQ